MVVEQVIRPTGLLDPIIEVRPSHNQIDDLMEEIQVRIEKNERTLVTTLSLIHILLHPLRSLRSDYFSKPYMLYPVRKQCHEGYRNRHSRCV